MPIQKIQHIYLENKCLSYGFFSRNGGVSEYPFNSLNCSFNVNDNKNNVKENLKLVGHELRLKKIIKLNQIHSSKVLIINNKNKQSNFLNADGLVTNLTSLGLSILGADCAPILFFDDKSETIGACHAGWKGALANIVESTIVSMEKIGANRKNINAVIGPTIQKQSYEIREDVAKIVKESTIFKRNESILSQTENDKYLFDLPLLLKENLKICRINKIGDININTYDNDLFFSHRYSSHQNSSKLGITGRHISVIGILK